MPQYKVGDVIVWNEDYYGDTPDYAVITEVGKLSYTYTIHEDGDVRDHNYHHEGVEKATRLITPLEQVLL